MKLNDFSDDKLKSIIMDGIMNHRNSDNPKFSHEKVSVGYEIITYTNKNPTDEETKRIDSIYNQIINSLD